jgi:hypothetical protein
MRHTQFRKSFGEADQRENVSRSAPHDLPRDAEMVDMAVRALRGAGIEDQRANDATLAVSQATEALCEVRELPL